MQLSDDPESGRAATWRGDRPSMAGKHCILKVLPWAPTALGAPLLSPPGQWKKDAGEAQRLVVFVGPEFYAHRSQVLACCPRRSLKKSGLWQPPSRRLDQTLNLEGDA